MDADDPLAGVVTDCDRLLRMLAADLSFTWAQLRAMTDYQLRAVSLVSGRRAAGYGAGNAPLPRSDSECPT